MKILVIEDREINWEWCRTVLTQVCDIPEADITRAHWYTEAEQKIQSEQYDLVLLDHRMPYDDPGCTDISDFRRFRTKLENIGYALMPLLRSMQPHAVIVGTSSLGISDIGPSTFTIPDRKLDKSNMLKELPMIIKSLS